MDRQSKNKLNQVIKLRVIRVSKHHHCTVTRVCSCLPWWDSPWELHSLPARASYGCPFPPVDASVGRYTHMYSACSTLREVKKKEISVSHSLSLILNFMRLIDLCLLLTVQLLYKMPSWVTFLPSVLDLKTCTAPSPPSGKLDHSQHISHFYCRSKTNSWTLLPNTSASLLPTLPLITHWAAALGI